MRRAFLALALAALCAGGAAAQDAGRITGVGGVFVRSKDPKALMAWYRDVLGVRLEPWGGAALRYDAPGHPPVVVWNAMRADNAYFAPSSREFMLDFAVDDLDAFLVRLRAKGVQILGVSKPDSTGAFAWILDPDGTKLELWQPPAR
ncbi:MAG TPA: VOC family protein [Caulobacteraceae bacterium]|nr:VOC family protein [Caulobacteraceae bacterium]